MTTAITKEQQLRQAMAQVRALHDSIFEHTGCYPAAHVHTYGCQQNVSDGEKLKGMLTEMGYAFTDSPQAADLVLYNTCAVREGAEDRVFGNVGALKQAKRRNPDMIVALCGCMVQQRHIADRLRQSFPYVDMVFGTHAMADFPSLLYQRLTQGGRVFSVEESDGGTLREDLPVRRDGAVRAWLPVMYGCDNFCTYCVVPHVRGRERSREPGFVLDEARKLVAEGYKDITLLGQNVNSYGKNLAEPVSFARLLRQINGLGGDFRIRFMTSHPKDCTRELIDTIADCEKICNHLHLPVQSGSDRVLKAMNRHYTARQYLDLIDYARQRIPDIAFTSDIIVGFPGETREDFLHTLELVRRVEYHSLFTFVYSKRVGTRAAEMDDSVPPEEKSRWFQELLDIQGEIGAHKYGELVGRTLRVLADSSGKSGEGVLCGRTEQGVIVEFPGNPAEIGCFYDIHITKALKWAVLGNRA